MTNGGDNYSIDWDGGDYWKMGKDNDPQNVCEPSMWTYINDYSATPPATTWNNRCCGSDPIIVEIQSAKITFSATQLVENSSNDGTFSTSITITHNNYNGATFTGNNGDNFVTAGKISVNNLPAGLIASIVRSNSLQLTLTLTGTAAAHTNASDINNLNINFNNSAFSDNDAANTINANSNIAVNFIDVFNVGTGQTYTTIQSAINAASSYDIVSLAAETFKESGININNKCLTIIGQSPTQTIIQANANAGAASDRVFLIDFNSYAASNTVNFERLTIRNGNHNSGFNGQQGGVQYKQEELL